MSRAVQILREERALLQRQLSAIDNAIAALSETTEKVAKSTGGPSKGKPMAEQSASVGVKKHGRVWTPAMRAAASKRAKARLAGLKKKG
jgi:hypothetical protein